MEHCEEPVETERKANKECKKRGKEGEQRGGWGQRRKRLKGSQQMGSEKKDEVKQRMRGKGRGGGNCGGPSTLFLSLICWCFRLRLPFFI